MCLLRCSSALHDKAVPTKKMITFVHVWITKILKISFLRAEFFFAPESFGLKLLILHFYNFFQKSKAFSNRRITSIICVFWAIRAEPSWLCSVCFIFIRSKNSPCMPRFFFYQILRLYQWHSPQCTANQHFSKDGRGKICQFFAKKKILVKANTKFFSEKSTIRPSI